MISKTWAILKIAHGVIGMSAGISGCIVFARNYDNVNGAVWAAISAFVAFLYVIVNRSVYRDVARVINTQCFSIYMVLGCVFIVAGSVAMITYLAIGLSHKQGLGPKASYIGVVWGFMTFKWALILLLSARRFRKQYKEIEGNTMVINDDIE